MEILKLLLNFASESPFLTFFLFPFVFALIVFIVVAICATILDGISLVVRAFKKSKGEKK